MPTWEGAVLTARRLILPERWCYKWRSPFQRGLKGNIPHQGCRDRASATSLSKIFKRITSIPPVLAFTTKSFRDGAYKGKIEAKQSNRGAGEKDSHQRQDKQPFSAQGRGSSSYVCWRELMSCVSAKYVENLCLFLSSRSGLS